MLQASWGDDAPALKTLGAALPPKGRAALAAGGLKAAADYLGNGAIEINRYENEILDIVQRESPFLARLLGRARPATGQPHRYFEQTAIAQGQFVTITNGSVLGTPTASGPIRVERTVYIKAISAQTNISLFDADVTRQQGDFASVEAQDISDISAACVRQAGFALWNGTDTSLTTPTTNQYMGLLAQINQTLQIGIGASIIDGLKAQVAYMVANTDFKVRPTGIVINPILGDYIDREAKAMKITLNDVTVGGVVVKGLSTQAGILPLIPESYLGSVLPGASQQYGFTAAPTGYKNYFAVIITEDMIDLPFVHGGDRNPKPRIFQLGLVGGLLGQYVGIWFNAVVAKGVTGATIPSGAYTPASTCYAHSLVAVTRQ
jgi:hypothetical protein